jgi:transcription elongation factor Elf1
MNQTTLTCPSCRETLTAHHELVVPMKNVRANVSCATCSKDYFVSVRFGIESDNPDYKDAKWLFDQYITNKRTMAEIAGDQGVSAVTIDYWLKKLNITTRPRGRKVE